MLQRCFPFGALALLALLAPRLASAPQEPLDPERPIASLVPADSLAFVEGTGLAAFFDAGLEHPLLRHLSASEFGTTLAVDHGLTFDAGVVLADTMFGRPVLPTLASMLRHGAALALRAGAASRGGPSFVLVLHGDDAERSGAALARVLEMLAHQHGLDGAFDEPHAETLGAQVWRLGDDLWIARRDGLVLVSNDKEYGRDVLELAAEPKQRGLLGRDDFRAEHGARASDETLWAWFDLESWEESAAGALGKLRAIADNPGAQALLGPGLATLGSGDTLAATLRLGARDAHLSLSARGVGAATVLRPSTDGAGSARPAPLEMEGDVLQGVLHRDYAALLRHRAELFAPDALPSFSKMISQLSLFFGGQDIGEDVLPHVSPWLRLVSRPVEYAPERAPEIPLPALVIVAQLDDDPLVGPRFVSSFQTLIGILNADRAQKDGRTMQLRLGLEGDVEVSSAHFLAPAPGDGVDMVYNLEPACALVDRQLVLGTHAHLVRAVIRQLRADGADAGERGPVREHLRLVPAALAQALERNFETLVMQKVLEEGMDYGEAESEIGGALLLLASFEALEAEVSYPAPGEVSAALRLTLFPAGEGAR